jgi:hypothetical protein
MVYYIPLFSEMQYSLPTETCKILFILPRGTQREAARITRAAALLPYD